MALMGYREYSRHRGVTLRAVQKAIEAGRIRLVEVDGKPRIDSAQADADWIENTDPAKQSLLFSSGPEVKKSPREAVGGLASAAGAGAVASGAAASASDDDAPRADDTDAYRRERALREAIRREREQLELDEAKGNLVDKTEVARLRFTEFRALRDALANLAPRIAPLVAQESDPIVCEQIYTDALEQILTAVADQVLTRHVLQDDDDDDEDLDTD